MAQRTIVLEYDNKKIVSQPFNFEHACIIDDEKYRSGGLVTGARLALQKMFEGTIITDEVIDKIDGITGGLKALRDATDKILNWFVSVDEETKN